MQDETPGGKKGVVDVKLVKAPIATVTVVGDIDRYTAPRVTALIRQACKSGRDIILDLSGVSYVDTIGAEQVYLASRLAKDNGGRAAVVIRSPHIRRILEILGYSHLPNLAIVSDLDAAVKYVSRT